MDLSALDFTHHRGRLAFTLALVALEFCWLWFVTARDLRRGRQLRRAPYDLKESFATLGVVIGQNLTRLAVAPLLAPIYLFAAGHRQFAIEMRGIVPWLLLILLVDFLYYWAHRGSHRIAAFWATHSVHHSSTRFNLSAAYRLGWTNFLTANWLMFLVPVLIGFPLPAVVLAVGLNLSYQLLLHTTVVDRLGPLEWVLNTPNHHRVHHATNASCLDRNFGGILILFDRLFGTFAEVRQNEPLQYGTLGRPRSYNPIAIALGGWVELITAMRRAGSAWRAMKTLFGRPV